MLIYIQHCILFKFVFLAFIVVSAPKTYSIDVCQIMKGMISGTDCWITRNKNNDIPSYYSQSILSPF